MSLPEALLAPLSERLARDLGLFFPRGHWRSLQQGLREITRELGHSDPATGAAWLLGVPFAGPVLEALARHLTVGETYFFRDPAVFSLLETHILPDLLAARRAERRPVRIWSAGCCTGEEPYSLAIQVHRLLGTSREWPAEILATDLNPSALARARTGTYRSWSFRNTPAWVLQGYFQPAEGGQREVVPEIREKVRFAALNFARDRYPSPETGTENLDVVFCRNVLMYFTPDLARTVVDRLYRCLTPGGWLIVSAAEASPDLFAQFETVHLPGAILYRKPTIAVSPGVRLPLPRVPKRLVGRPPVPPPKPAPRKAAVLRGAWADPAPDRGGEGARQTSPTCFVTLARASADNGRLTEALDFCNRALIRDRMSPEVHFLHGTVLQALGQADAATAALRRALYLDPALLPAHCALGSLSRNQGRPREAARHFHNALALLGRHDPETVLPATDGMTAGRMQALIEAGLAGDAQ